MATKKISKSGTYNIKINSKSGDTVYVLKNSSLASSVTLNFVRAGGYDTYSDVYKSGNDLIVTTLYGEKLITNTIKDYFLYDSSYPSSLANPNLVKFDGSSISSPYAIRKSYANGLFSDANNEAGTILGSKGSDTYLITKSAASFVELKDFGGNDNYNIQAGYTGQAYLNLTDYKGNDNYNMSNNTNVYLKDKKGNDIYRADYAKKVLIADDAGNDKYTIMNTVNSTALAINITDSKGKDIYEISAKGDTNSEIIDNAGNDKYLLSNGGKIFEITDELGNDSYELYKSSNDTSYIYDNAGNDKYTVSSTQNKTIRDKKGNDNYNLYDTNTSIYDDGGKDSYTANKTDYLNIHDKAGNDKYNISNSAHLTIAEGEEGSKKGGNDTYNISNVDQVGLDSISNQYSITDWAGKDSYNITNGSKIRINDRNVDKKTSADKYNISVSSQARIYDDAGNDTYKVNTSRAYITDNLGSDKYTITDGNNYYDPEFSLNNSNIDDSAGNDSYKISNSTVVIGDGAGKDTYTISSNSDVKITDLSSSKDTYNVNTLSSKVTINDKGGKGDTLKITGTNKSNLVFMANFTDENGVSEVTGVEDGSLLIFDKTQNGFICVKDYFVTTGFMGQRGILPTYSDGVIENIYVGKANLNKDITSYAQNYTSIIEEVAGWLTNNSYDSVMDLVSTGTTKDVSEFIATFVANQ